MRIFILGVIIYSVAASADEYAAIDWGGVLFSSPGLFSLVMGLIVFQSMVITGLLFVLPLSLQITIAQMIISLTIFGVGN